MTGLSASTLEVIVLVLTLGTTIFGFMYGRTRKMFWRYLQLGDALMTTEMMKLRDKARAREKTRPR